MAKDGKLTPAMQQFMHFKNTYPDCLILFRMGDFYEMFFEDAKIAANVLSITLTKRGSHKGEPIPLAGVPYHALEQYLGKLIRAGIKTAICEQVEDPKKAKGIVKRDVVRVVTPGTIVENNLLDAKANNFIISIYKKDEQCGIAIGDLSTSEFLCTDTHPKLLLNEIMRLSPSEILLPESERNNPQIKEIIDTLKQKKIFISYFEDYFFRNENAEDTLTNHFNVLSLDGFGLTNKDVCISASGALLYYLKETQKTNIKNFNTLKWYANTDHMILDTTTATNLELMKNVRDNSTNNTLLSVLDKTKTAMGGRCLRKWLLRPLLNVQKINNRLDAVEELKENILLRENIKEHLNTIHDIERLLSRIALGSCNARDCIALKRSLQTLPKVKEYISTAKSQKLKTIATLSTLKELTDLLERSITEEPPATVREGGMIKTSYHAELDELHDIMKNGKIYLKDLEEKEKKKTGIKNLRIKFNRVFGYFLEVTKANISSVPPHYVRKQTMANAERYITDELKQQEEKILHAEERVRTLEYELFQEILQNILKETITLQETAKKIAQLDVLASFATIAVDNNYAKPKMHDKFELELIESRHPVIERLEEVYIPNNVRINKNNRTMIITGPNMAGKSSILRQVALINLMAQMGSFVPAKVAYIPLVDRIFTRVGAHDDLTHGQSTFMVEMSETASILNNATEKSLILMDEIGRGTSTFDGVSIAWSVAEYITEKIKAKMMFATHYHVLTKLAKLEGVQNYNVAVKENDDEIIFLRKLIEGGTDKSYGIHVAKLAGMPEAVINKARAIQNQLEGEDTMHEKVVMTTEHNKPEQEEQTNQREDKKESIITATKAQDGSLQNFFS